MSWAITHRKGLGFEDGKKLKTREVGKEANVGTGLGSLVNELYVDFEHAV
jgi:hypothetical protein